MPNSTYLMDIFEMVVTILVHDQETMHSPVGAKTYNQGVNCVYPVAKFK